MDPILKSMFAKICADFNFVELHVSLNQVCANTFSTKKQHIFIFLNSLKSKISLLINSKENLMSKTK